MGVLPEGARHFTIGETTNNRLQSFNAKVKSVCSRYASLDSFFSDFLAVLRVLRDERVHASTVTSISRIISTPDNMMGADLQYKDLLTSYAYEKVLLQVARRDATKLPDDIETLVTSSEGPLHVTTVACTCGFRCSFRLPCRHILARRRMDGLLAFDPSLADRRWTSAYSPDPQPAPPSSTLQVRATPATAAGSVPTSHQKYRQLMTVAAEMAGYGSEFGMREYVTCLGHLQEMRDAWRAAASMPSAASTQPAPSAGKYLF